MLSPPPYVQRLPIHPHFCRKLNRLASVDGRFQPFNVTMILRPNSNSTLLW